MTAINVPNANTKKRKDKDKVKGSMACAHSKLTVHIILLLL